MLGPVHIVPEMAEIRPRDSFVPMVTGELQSTHASWVRAHRSTRIPGAMRWSPRRLCVPLLALGIAGAGIAGTLPGRETARASYVAWGSVLVPGSAWAGSVASRGDLNVYSNGTGSQDVYAAYGMEFECVELAQRWAAVAFGEQPHWPVLWAYQMWSVGPTLSVPLQQYPNGGGVPPQFGDILVFNQTSTSQSGHVAVVAGTGPGWVDIVEQNWDNANPTGTARLSIDGTTMPVRFGLPILGWLRPGPRVMPGPGGVLVDAHGGLYGVGSVPTPNSLGGSLSGPVRGIARVPGHDGGYVVEGSGALHPFGGAVPVTAGATWPGLDIARGVAVRADGAGGYTVDEWGGVHPFGNAPAPQDAVRWVGGPDIARGIVLRSDGSSGYVLLSNGGLRPFGGAPRLDISGSGYSTTWMVGVALRSNGTSGWEVDRHGILHAFGGAPGVATAAGSRFIPGGALPSTGIIAADDGGGWVVTESGRLVPFGDAPAAPTPSGVAAPVVAAS